MERTELLKRLHKLLGPMDLPGHKKVPTTNDSLRWLGKAMVQRNSEHRNFREATELLRKLGVEHVAGA